MFNRLTVIRNRFTSSILASFFALILCLTVSKHAFAASTLTLPAIDLTDFYAAVTVLLGVAVAVMIVKKIRGQIR